MRNQIKKYKDAADQSGMEKYRKLRNAINNECKKSKEAFLNNNQTEVNKQMKSVHVDKI